MKRLLKPLLLLPIVVAATVLVHPAGAAAESTPDPGGDARVAAGPLARSWPYLAHRAAPALTTAPPSVAPGLAAAQACVAGTWTYQDLSGPAPVNRPSANYQVQVWEDDDFDADHMIAAGLTNGLGKYNFCFDNADDDGGLCCWGGQDVFLKFVSENTTWAVHDTTTKQPFVTTTGVVKDLPDGSTHDFGALQTGNANQMGGTAIFDFVNGAFNWKPGNCWDANDVVCRQMVLNWRFDAPQPGSFYDAVANQVFLTKNAHLFPDLVLHEAGHAIMDDVYSDKYPDPAACGAGHPIDKFSSLECGWAEGFASWIPLMVKQSPVLVLPNSLGVSVSMNMENMGWDLVSWSTGPGVEGRVTGALWDIADVPNVNETWDRNSDLPALPFQPGNIWKTFLGSPANPPQTFAEFWKARAADPANNVSPTGALASVYQNTIDIDFRDPLSNNVAVSRPTPFNPHNFSFNTTTKFWSVVAVAPPAATDYDLDLFTDKAQLSNLKSSTAGPGIVDFVAIDSNQGKQPLGDFYPRVRRFNNVGTGVGKVELAQGSQSLALGATKSIVMPTADLVDVWDVFISTNTPATITFSATAGLYQAFLFTSASGGSIKGRSQALVSTATIGFGSPQTLTTPAVIAGGWHGLVLVKTSGTGTLTVKRVA